MALPEIDVGSLRHRVTVQSVTRTQGANGEVQEAWADVRSVWAKVEPVSARELYAAQQAQVAVSHRVTMRYQSDLTALSHRLVFEGRYLAIAGLRDLDERRVWHEAICLEWGA